MSDPRELVRLGFESDRIKRACAVLDGLQRHLEGALRRALPHLARNKTPIAAMPARALLRGDLDAALEKPRHVIGLAVGQEVRAAGALVVDGLALAHGMDGMLGAGRGDIPTLDPNGLSAAQAAVAARLGTALVAALGEVTSTVGAPLHALEGGAEHLLHGALLACVVCIGEAEKRGTIALLVPSSSIHVETPVAERVGVATEAMKAAMGEVEVEAVAELGRAKLSLARIARLRVGDVVRLPLPVDGPVRVFVGGRCVLRGKPTAKGSQISVEIVGHGP